MSRIKPAVLLMAQLVLVSSISIAQEQDQDQQQSQADGVAQSAAPSCGDSSNSHEYVRPTRLPRAVTGPDDIRPFRSIAVGLKADTLGAGVQIATPVSRSFNLRSSFNVLAFNDGFNVDGLNYSARLHLKSNETVLDWFVLPGIHISPGILWAKNTMTAPVSVAPGQTFSLGGQSFINSVDDPVNGSATVGYAHSFSPLLLVGIGNIIPRNGGHLSIPIEIGFAYTGSPQLNLNIKGTMCTSEGCVDLSQNTDAQTSLKQEIKNLNKDLGSYPVFPIVSLGLAYHF